MLSKTSIVILGLLCKGEKNAYDMLKMIDSMNMKYWLPIGATTLYETCLRLQKKLSLKIQENRRQKLFIALQKKVNRN